MRVLVTGAAGFIGSNLVDMCLDAGYGMVGVDDGSNGHPEFLPIEAAMMWCDFADDAVLEKIRSKRFDVVFHLAAMPRVSYSVEHPFESNDTNVSKTLKLMEACRGNIKRFVFASSCSVYGDAETIPTAENEPKKPRSPYALQKSIIEDYLKMFGELYDFDSICLRFFNVFGENALGSSPYATALASWLTAIREGRPMRSDGDGSQSRDLVHVDNVCDALIKAAGSSRQFRGHVFNVGTGERVTNQEILKYLLKRYPGSTFENAPERPGDVLHTQAKINSIAFHLGYRVVVPTWAGIERTCAWYDSNWSWIKDLKKGILHEMLQQLYVVVLHFSAELCCRRLFWRSTEA